MGFFSMGVGGGSRPIQNQEPGSEEVTGTTRRKRTGNIPVEFTSYFGRPVIKKASWKWEIWTYFWTGGIAGGASAITALFELFGNKERDQSIIRAGHYVSLVNLIVSPILLIMDLGRPERFYQMLRVLKLRSPLNVGTFLLTGTGVLSGINTARQVVEDGLVSRNSLPGHLALLSSGPVTKGLQGIGGLAVGSYTGVVLSATATPLWAEADTTMGPIFLSTAISNGAAAISLVRALLGSSEADVGRLDQIEQIAILSELGLISYTALKMKPEVRQAFLKSAHSKVFLIAVLFGQVLPFLVQLFNPGKGVTNRLSGTLTSISVLVGGLLLRYSIVEGGKATVEDPSAYHAITRGKARPGPEELDAENSSR